MTEPSERAAPGDHPKPDPGPRHERDAATVEFAASALRPGRILGNRYRVDRVLGQGGMGEVWQAYDLKLCIEVALKMLLLVPGQPERRELLRREVRAAREVMSPNVCRIFDLVEFEGQEMVSMEYVDGIELGEHLRRCCPLPLQQALEVAGQMLAGLQAIHEAGLVHRDLKPANVMITHSGRVVVMDFGLAKAVTAGGQITIAGTPAYMAPEQISGGAVDPRTDIFAAGIVLAELSFEGKLDVDEARETIWRGVRRQPPEVPQGPWKGILSRAVAADPDARYPSARALARALEDITLRHSGRVDRSPFPGLSAFTEGDAEYFFGREAEVEALGKKLKRLHLLAVVGPSGVGKSSFLRAGLMPSLPPDCAHVICAPGTSPMLALGQALAPHLAGDAEAMRALLRWGEPDVAISVFQRWRGCHAEAIVVLDQFEELFTQNLPEAQHAFAEFLGRLPLEADVRVLLSLRDDFLFHCHAYPGLRPIMTELTLLAPLAGPDLRRVLVNPARACGIRFEDDTLLDEMVAAVQTERGALPLLAFTAARLWERRDREHGMLTRAAYEEIGGVAGSLAQHAEETLGKIGAVRQGTVREIFRNLITAQGTRVSRARDELLSVFPESARAAEVLDGLIDARLLNAFDAVDPQNPEVRQQRVELIHESLLSNWPRLVRWQTQEADGAQLRDELRQAARFWDERGKPQDLLWTGSMYQEFRLWRERYPGGLTSTEESFAAAMTDHARRRQRRRRTGMIVAFSALLLVLAIVGALWLRAGRAQKRAEAAARRSEAGKLYTMAENERDPANAVAYALAALELSEQVEYRRSALKALLRAPGLFRLPTRPESQHPFGLDFSPDGRWFAVGWSLGGGLQLYSMSGGDPLELRGHRNRTLWVRFSEDSKRLASSAWDSTVRVWSVPDGRLLRTISSPTPMTMPFFRGGRLLTCELIAGQPPVWKSWPPDGGEATLLGRAGPVVSGPEQYAFPDVDPSGSWIIQPEAKEVVLYSLKNLGAGPVRAAGRHAIDVAGVRFAPDGDRVASFDGNGTGRLWSLRAGVTAPVRTFPIAQRCIWAAFSRTGSRLAFGGSPMLVYDLRYPEGAGTVLSGSFLQAFDPEDRWIATSNNRYRVDLWSVPWLDAIAYRDTTVYRAAFSPDGRWLATASAEGMRIRVQPIEGRQFGAAVPLYQGSRVLRLGWDEESRRLYATVYDDAGGGAGLLRIEVPGGAMQTWNGPGGYGGFFLSRDGEWVATGPDAMRGIRTRVFHYASGRSWNIGTTHEGPIGFLADGRLLRTSGNDLVAWSPEDQQDRPFLQGDGTIRRLRPDRETFLCFDEKQGWFLRRLDGTEVARLPAEAGRDAPELSVTPSGGLFAFGCANGDVEAVLPATGSIRRLPMHRAFVRDISAAPDGRWVASTAEDGLRIWTVPDSSLVLGSPRDRFMNRLRSLTNLRAVPNAQSPTGYVVESSGLPDWGNPPKW